MKETKLQAQMRAIGEYIASCSALPDYSMYLKYCSDKDKNLFTSSTFPKYFWLKNGVDIKTAAGRNVVKYFKDQVKAGDIDMSTVAAKDSGIYARKYGESTPVCIYGLGHINGRPSLNKTVRDVKSGQKIVMDFTVSFNLPISRKMHLMVDKNGAHIRFCDAYISEAFKSKKLYKVS